MSRSLPAHPRHLAAGCICQNSRMRLTPIEQQIIREASLRWFGVRPRLFGSRLDDLKRGGDINLHIKALVSPQPGLRRGCTGWLVSVKRLANAKLMGWSMRVVGHCPFLRWRNGKGSCYEHLTWQAEALHRARTLGLQLIDWLARLTLEFEQRKTP